MDNNVLADKIIELFLQKYDLEKEYDIKLIIKKIQFIENQINSFKENKPLFVSKRRKKEYQERISKLQDLKEMLYNSLGKEL